MVHVVEVGGSLDSVLDAIRSELDDCDVHALVVDVARGLTVRGMDIDRIAGVLEDRGIDRLQIRLDQDGDGQSIVISLV